MSDFSLACSFQKTVSEYTILSGMLPLDYMRSSGSEIPAPDKIATMCCFLSVNSVPVLPLKMTDVEWYHMHMAGMKRIGVQPTAIARRRMCCGVRTLCRIGGPRNVRSPMRTGNRCIDIGRPTKQAITLEHGYSRLKKSKSVASVQQVSARRLPAPYNMAEFLSRNVSLGKTHSTK